MIASPTPEIQQTLFASFASNSAFVSFVSDLI